jgi:hypothetical protein
VAKRKTPRSQSPTLSGTSEASLADPAALTVTPLEAIPALSTYQPSVAPGRRKPIAQLPISALPPISVRNEREGPPPPPPGVRRARTPDRRRSPAAPPPRDGGRFPVLLYNPVSLSKVMTVRLAQPLRIGVSSPCRRWAVGCSQESVFQVRERAVPMGLSRVPGCLLCPVFTQHSLVISLHKSPHPTPPQSHHPDLQAAPLTNGAVLPGDVSVICLQVFGGLPGLWKALAKEKAFGFRLRGRGAGGAGAVLYGTPGCLWAVSILPFGCPIQGFQGESGNCREKRSSGGDLVIRGGTVPADAWIGSFFLCSKPIRNAHLRAPKSLCKRRARVACSLPPRPRLCRARHRCRQSTPGAPPPPSTSGRPPPPPGSESGAAAPPGGFKRPLELAGQGRAVRAAGPNARVWGLRWEDWVLLERVGQRRHGAKGSDLGNYPLLCSAQAAAPSP